MQLNPHPRIFNPNDESIEQFGKTPALYSKYIFHEQPDESKSKQSDSILYEDIANDEFNQILNAKDDIENGLLTQPVPLKLKDEQFPRILFLGTSSADSCLLRNSTGILVHLS